MKSILASLSLSNSLLRLVLATALFALPVLGSAKDRKPIDRAAQQLATTGSIPVRAAGPNVELGTFRIQVIVMLGRPGTVLPDGTWLYPNFEAEESTACGTLVVRFNDRGRVSDMSLVTPSVVGAIGKPRQTQDKTFVARQR
jgi:hypothetical protein